MKRLTGAFVACLGLLGGCAGVTPLPAGSSPAQVTQSWGPPTFQYPLPEGGTRYEYNGGTWGAQTWMVDFNNAGQMTASRNVRAEASFNTIQPGMTAQQVQLAIGAPSEIWALTRQNQMVWSYRYFSAFCQWFMVGMKPDNTVADASYGPDPACDRPFPTMRGFGVR